MSGYANNASDESQKNNRESDIWESPNSDKRAEYPTVHAHHYRKIASFVFVAAKRGMSSINFWVALGTWALAILAFLAYEISQDTERRQLRAYVGRVANGGSIGFGTLHGQYAATVPFTNYGQTPAYNVQTIIKVTILGYPLSDWSLMNRYEDDLGPTNPGDNTVFTQEAANVTGVARDTLDQRGFIAVLFSPIKRIYAYGRIEYVDAFGAHHTSRFCLTFRGVVDPSVIANMKTWDKTQNMASGEDCPRGNSTD